MAGKTYTQKIEFKGHFDGKQVLDELKKIRQNMADAGADANLFKGIDKDIAATERLVTEMMAQIQRGFSNTKEVSVFEKQIDKLQTNFLKISSGMKNINVAENFTVNSEDIKRLTQEINRLTAAQDHLKEASKQALQQSKENLGLTDNEVKEIKKAIDANENLESTLKKVGQAKEKAFKSRAGVKGLETETGKKFIRTANAGVTLDDLGATAISGTTAKKKNDARKRDSSGNLLGSKNNRLLDEQKANAAINESYKKVLESTIESGGNAADAIEEMRKALKAYGIEISNVDKLQENFANDLNSFFSSDAISQGGKSAITKAAKIGATNAQGVFELSEEARKGFVENETIAAPQRNQEEIQRKNEQLVQARQEAAEQAEQAVEKENRNLENTEENIRKVTEATRESAEATRDSTESADKLNDSFENMKLAVRTFLSIGSALSALRGVIQNTFNDIKSLDKSFAEIAMVTDYSVQEMWSSYDQYAAMANDLGQSTQSVIQASGLFYQQGLDTADSLALTKDTMKLATLAGLDFAEATSQMTAALRGFHMEMDEGGRVTDVYSELAAKAAADVEGIAYAMSKTASIASSAGMEFETTSAFLTQMIETTQEAPENIGTASLK